MNCPRCAGLMIGEEVQVHSGRFHGHRCVQCGLWLDKTIAQNRVDSASASDDVPSRLAGASSVLVATAARHTRPKRRAGKT